MRRSSPEHDASKMSLEILPQPGVGQEPTWAQTSALEFESLLRASGSTARPSDSHEGHIETRSAKDQMRKSVSWIGGDDVRNSLRSSRSEGILVRNKKRQESPSPSIPPTAQSEHDLQTQLNLLRERSWTEQQSLRRQLEDSKASQEHLKKELENSTVHCQQLQNEAQDLQDRVAAAGGLAEDAAAARLFEEKNAQIRNLEALVKELTCSQAISVGTLRPPSSNKQMELRNELEILRAERTKEQEDLKELEHVVAAFEAKMASIKQENKDLRRTIGELRQNIAQSEEAGHRIVPLASMQERKLQSINESLSRRVLEITIQHHDLRCLLSAFNLWRPAPLLKAAKRAERPDGDVQDEVDSLSDQNVSLRFQLEKRGKEVSALQEELDRTKAMYGNMLESERTQSAVLAQRMMKVDDGEQSLSAELKDLRQSNKALAEQLAASHRRLQYLDTERRGGEEGSAEAQVRRLQDNVASLQDDVASLSALRAAAAQRLALIREVGILRTVAHKRHASLARFFHAWRACPLVRRDTEMAARWLRGAKDKVLCVQAVQGWAVAARFVSKAEEGERAQQLEAVKATATALQEGRAGLSRELQAQRERSEELSTVLCLRQLDLDAAHAHAATAHKHIAALRAVTDTVQSGGAQLMEELCAMKQAGEELEAGLRRAEEGQRAAEQRLRRLAEEREGWLMEESRMKQRQAGGAGAWEAQCGLLEDKCKVLKQRLEATERERGRGVAAFESAAMVRDGMHSLLLSLNARAVALSVRCPPPAQHKMDVTDPESCARQLSLLGREVEAVTLGLAAAAQEANAKLDRVLSSGGAMVGGQPSQASAAREEELRELRERVSGMATTVRDKTEEAERQRGQHELELHARQQQAAALSASLTLAQSQIKYLQDIADGGGGREAFAQTLRGLQGAVQTLNGKLSAKTAECQQLQRHLSTASTESQRALLDAHQENRELRRRLHGAATESEGDASVVNDTSLRSRSELELSGGAGAGIGGSSGVGAESERVEAVMQANAALSSEVREMTALWRASAAEAFESNCSLERMRARHAEVEAAAKQRQAELKKEEAAGRKLAEEKGQLETEVKRVAAKLKEAEEQASDARRAVDERKAEKNALQAAMGGMAERMRETEERLAESEEREAALQSEVDKLRLERQTLQTETERSRVEAASLRQQVRLSLTSCVEEVAGVWQALCSLGSEREVEGMREELARGQLENQCAVLRKQLDAAQTAAAAAAEGGSGLEERVRGMEAETTALREQATEAAERAQALSAEKETLGQQLASLEEERGRLAQEAGKARREAEATRQELEEERGDWEQEKGALEEEAARLRSRGEEAERAAETLREQLEVGEREAGRLKAEVEAARRGERTQEQREQRLRKEVEDAQGQLHAEEEERARETARRAAEQEELRARLEEATKERERRERAEGAARKECEAVEEKRRALAAALSEAEGEASHVSGRVKAVTRERDELAERVRELAESVAEGRRRIAELERAVEESEGRERAAARSVAATTEGAEERLEGVRAELEQQRQETARVQSEREYLRERVQALKAQGEEGRREVEEREREVALAIVQRTALSLRLAEAARELEGRDRTVGHLERAAERREAELFKVAGELCSAREVVAELESHLEGTRGRVEATSRAEEELRGKVHVMEAEARERAEQEQAREEEVAGEMARMREEAGRLQSEVEEARVRAAELEGDVSRGEDGMRAAAEEAASLQQQVEELTRGLTTSREEAKRCDALHQEARAEAEEVRGLLEAERGERERQEAVMQEMQAVLEQAEGELERREERARAAGEQVGELEAALQSAAAEATAREGRLREVEGGLERCRAELAGAEERVEEGREAVVALMTRQGELEAAMEAMWQEGENSKAALATAEEEVRRVGEELAGERVGAEAEAARVAEERQRLEGEVSRAGAEVQELKGRAAKAKAHAEGLARRVAEAEEESGRAGARVAEYDEILQGKGREVAKLHGRLAEEAALVAEANERLDMLRATEETLRGELAGRERQLKRMQADLDYLHAAEGGEGEEREEGRRAAGRVQELEALVVQYQLAAVEHKLSSSAPDMDAKPQHGTAKLAAAGLVVAAGHDGVGTEGEGTREAAEEMGNPEAENDSEGGGEAGRVRAELRRVTEALHDAQRRCAALVKDGARADREEEEEEGRDASRCLEAGEGRELAVGALRRLGAERRMARHKEAALKALEDNWMRATSRREGMVHLLVRCQASIRRRAAGRAQEEERARLREEAVAAAGEAKVGLQRELVEKTDALLAAEKKFANLLSWVQQGKHKASP